MAVFENLRNFIRHGKQAAVQSPDAVAGPEVLEPEHPKKKEAYDQAVKQIIAEENEQRSKVPRYSGLKEDRFALLEKIGDGAFSVVYRALDKTSQQEVAVKIIRKQDLSNSQRSSILKEVAIMRQLRHENVVDLIDFSESPEYYFIVLELIPGGELFHQIVRLTYFSEDLARHVIIQVANAIRYLHEEAGVVHRDIKPENLLFYPSEFIPSREKKVRKGDDDTKEDEGEFIPGVGAGGIGTIKLADFGLSKIIWDSKTMTPCGTVGYTAPEIVKDERYSKSVDMWALGCVLYTVLCGFPPFYDESIEVLTEKVAKGQFTFLTPWWDEISKSAKDLVSHLLTVDPEQRYTIDEFLSHPWVTQGGENPALVSSAVRTATQAKASRASGATVVANRRVKGPAAGRAAGAGAVGPVAPSMATSGGISAATTTKAFAPRGAVAGPDGQTHYRVIDGREEEISASQANAAYLSPAAVTLKEVFDVSNAVHRMEEENLRFGGASKRRGIVMEDSVINEEGEDDTGSSVSHVQRSLEKTSLRAGAGGAAGAGQGGHGQPELTPRALNGMARDGPLFELHLEGATLLGRRRKQHGDVGPSPTLVT